MKILLLGILWIATALLSLGAGPQKPGAGTTTPKKPPTESKQYVTHKSGVNGYGPTKEAALAEAISQIPKGATQGAITFSGGRGSNWRCRIEYTQQMEIKK